MSRGCITSIQEVTGHSWSIIARDADSKYQWSPPCALRPIVRCHAQQAVVTNCRHVEGVSPNNGAGSELCAADTCLLSAQSMHSCCARYSSMHFRYIRLCNDAQVHQ